jgi:hypothetical protein
MEFQPTTFEIGKNRIEALSDGIFAIVMTLLILELRSQSPAPARLTSKSRRRLLPCGRSSSVTC